VRGCARCSTFAICPRHVPERDAYEEWHACERCGAAFCGDCVALAFGDTIGVFCDA